VQDTVGNERVSVCVAVCKFVCVCVACVRQEYHSHRGEWKSLWVWCVGVVAGAVVFCGDCGVCEKYYGHLGKCNGVCMWVRVRFFASVRVCVENIMATVGNGRVCACMGVYVGMGVCVWGVGGCLCACVCACIFMCACVFVRVCVCKVQCRHDT